MSSLTRAFQKLLAKRLCWWRSECSNPCWARKSWGRNLSGTRAREDSERSTAKVSGQTISVLSCPENPEATPQMNTVKHLKLSEAFVSQRTPQNKPVRQATMSKAGAASLARAEPGVTCPVPTKGNVQHKLLHGGRSIRPTNQPPNQPNQKGLMPTDATTLQRFTVYQIVGLLVNSGQ